MTRELARRCDSGRLVRVVERLADGSRLYYDGPVLYTHVNAQGANLLPYIDAMARTLSKCSSVLVLGTAGGALATQLSRAGVDVTAVDDWGQAFDLARSWFHLPDDVECVPQEATAFLRAARRRWSAIAIDVFRGAEIPTDVLTSDFVRLLGRAVEPGGRIVWNVAEACDADLTKQIVHALEEGGFQSSAVSVLEADVGNTLVVGLAAAA